MVSEFLPHGPEHSRNSIRSTRNFLLHDRVSRDVRQQLRHRFARFSKQMKHERDPDKTVAREVDARINHATISFTTDHGAVQLHGIRNIYFADLRQKHRTIELLRDVCDCSSRREIGDDWTLLASEHEKSREHERVVFADRFALL